MFQVGRAGNGPMLEKTAATSKRLMNDKYGPGKWNRLSREYRRIQKYGDCGFRDPRSVILPDDGA